MSAGEKPGAKFPASTPSRSMVKIGRLDDSSLNIFNPKQAREKANHCKKKERKGKEEGEKNSKVEKPKIPKSKF